MKTLCSILVIFFLSFSAQAEWITVPPKYPTTEIGLLGDIVSRCPNAKVFKGGDSIEFAHEATHGVIASLKSDGKYTIYILEGRGYILVEPKLKLSDIAKKIPKELVGNNFRLYLLKQSLYWDDEPLYLMNEFIAYSNAACVADQLDKPSAFADEVRGSMEMFGYCIMLQKCANQTDINVFMDWGWSRIDFQYNQLKSKKLSNDKFDKMYKTLQEYKKI